MNYDARRFCFGPDLVWPRFDIYPRLFMTSKTAFQLWPSKLIHETNHKLKAHKNIPQIIGGGFVLLGVGNLLFSLPHFLTGQYVSSDKLTDICPLEDTCTENDSTSLQWWIVVFIIALGLDIVADK